MENYLSSLKFTSEIWGIILPIILIILDVITGVVLAWKNKNFKSSKMREGLSKKYGEILYLILGGLSKVAFSTSVIFLFFTIYISSMEILSLLENADKLGVPLPKEIAEKLNNKKEE